MTISKPPHTLVASEHERDTKQSILWGNRFHCDVRGFIGHGDHQVYGPIGFDQLERCVVMRWPAAQKAG